MLVIETNGYSGGFTLGFRIDPKDKLRSVTKELSSLFRIHSKAPEFGVHFVNMDQVNWTYKYITILINHHFNKYNLGGEQRTHSNTTSYNFK